MPADRPSKPEVKQCVRECGAREISCKESAESLGLEKFAEKRQTCTDRADKCAATCRSRPM
jgi:hypothetical protein